MKHILKTVSRFLLLGLTAGCGFFALQGNNQAYAPAFADDTPATKQYTEADFENEEQASSGELAVSIVESTTTNTSQSINVSFKTITLEGWKTARGNYIVSITDPNYTGKASEPVPEGYTRIDEESGLPILDGVVSFVLGSSSATNQRVRLPSTLTRDGSFIINVKAITSHCVTPTGAEYNNSNKWYNDAGDALKITEIYIPSSIEIVESEAFVGAPEEVKFFYEGESIPEGFESDWTDSTNITFNTSISDTYKHANIAQKVDDMSEPANFILGCKQSEKRPGEEYNRPLVIEYDKIKVDGSREKVFETLSLTNTVGNEYDSVGSISSKTASRVIPYKLNPGESIDDHSFVLHNLMKASDTTEIDTSTTYWARPTIGYKEKLDLSKLLTFKPAGNSTFGGFSIFSLTMDKNLTITSEKYPEPHSLYLDVKTDIYEQNKLAIEKGITRIRYSLNNLYLSSYRFVYESGGQLKEVIVPIKTVVYYQVLESNKNNKVSVIVENRKVAPDFSAEKVRTFELTNLTVQMDLFTTSNTGSTSILGKSAISYKFAYVTVRNNEKINVFNWNLFLIFFLIGFMALYAAGAFGLYKYFKEKYKNDEFRRVNDKKYLKKAILSGLGFTEIVAAILLIIMRVTGFANTIVGFNPTDPLLIAFAVAALIIGGYFIVILIKSIKTSKERRKAIRLRLNEDVFDDGTN